MNYTQEEIDLNLKKALDQLYEKELRKREINEEIKQVKKTIEHLQNIDLKQTKLL